MLEKNAHYNVAIEDIGTNGLGIGRVSGFTVFVDGALIGDVVETKIVKVKKNYAVGKLIRVAKPSAMRVKPMCDKFELCGGCTLQSLSYKAQLELKTRLVKNTLSKIGKIDADVLPIIGMENPYNYRNKAVFPIGYNRQGKLSIGLYAANSHNIVDVPACAIQHPVCEQIISAVRKFILDNNISVYNETTGMGLMRHLVVRTGFATDEVLVILVINGTDLPCKAILVDTLSKISGIMGIVLNINTARTSVALSRTVKTIWGNSHITDYIGDTKFEISPLSFYQVNPVQTKILYDTALKLANPDPNETLIDLYCGIGTIALYSSAHVHQVVGVEVAPEAIADAKRNQQVNNIANAQFIEGAVEEIVPKMIETENLSADIVVLDPPRRGCDEKLLQAIANISPKKVVYISCDPATLARDLAFLCENGFGVQCVQPIDMFPHTMHVETVVLLQRQDT